MFENNGGGTINGSINHKNLLSFNQRRWNNQRRWSNQWRCNNQRQSIKQKNSIVNEKLPGKGKLLKSSSLGQSEEDESVIHSQSFVVAAMTLMTVGVGKAEMMMIMNVTDVKGAMGATIATGERWCGGP